MDIDGFIAEENILLKEFAAFVCRRSKAPDPMLAEAAEIALAAVRAGHSCCDLSFCGSKGMEILKYAADNGGGNGYFPGTELLILEDTLLYLPKYSVYEEIIAAEVMKRAGETPHDAVEAGKIIALRDPALPLASEQLQACLSWLNSSFAVVTGGAGTGKTTIAATAAACELMRDPGCRIIAAAPTGKAQSRFLEAVAEETASLLIPADIKKQMLEIQCHTIESLIGISRNRRPARHKDNPLEADLLVVDECSMGSLVRLSQLFSALPERCRIVLLGDANQLFSVEAGSVFAEICSAENLKKNITELTENFRSKNNPQLVKTAAMICGSGSAEEKTAAFNAALEAKEGAEGEFSFVNTGRNLCRKVPEIISSVIARWEITPPETLEDALKSMEDFKILTPVVDGEAGVHSCNRIVAEILKIAPGDNGYPVMITCNDKRTGLCNGDCGVFWQGRVHFASAGGNVRSFAPADLPVWECAWCMTVHKSQGSGFRKVLTLLPEYGQKLLCCELFYTAVTRSKKHICIAGDMETVKFTLARRMRRFSGLRKKIAAAAVR